MRGISRRANHLGGTKAHQDKASEGDSLLLKLG